METTVGVVHPGTMGVSVATAAVIGGCNVVWASEGRSDATIARATAAAITDVGTVARLAHEADMIISVVPPSSALAVAEQVAATGFSGVYVDANAVSPQRLGAVADVMAGADFVDGGIIGPPADAPGTTRLYLSGPAASRVEALFLSTPLHPIVLGADTGVASALKMAYAGYTKGTAALIMAMRALAHHHGLSEALLAEWEMSQPGLGDRSRRILERSPHKAWRFAGEMDEIAATLAAAGLPSGFHDAAGDIFRRIGPQSGDVDAAEAVRRLL